MAFPGWDRPSCKRLRVAKLLTTARLTCQKTNLTRRFVGVATSMRLCAWESKWRRPWRIPTREASCIVI